MYVCETLTDLARGRKPKPGLIGRVQGAVYVEFLLVIWPLLLLLLGLTQIGLMYGAHLLVCQAAAKAVRAAVVIFPDENVDDYEGVEANHIGSEGEGGEGGEGGDASGDGSSSGLDAYKNAPDGGRLDQIRMAARIVLAPVAPSIEAYWGKSLAEGIGEYPITSSLIGVMGWNAKAVAVTFPDRSNAAKAAAEESNSENGDKDEAELPNYKTEFQSQEGITARVTFLYKCPVPLARSIMCKSYDDLPEQSKAELDTVGASSLGNIVTDFLGWRYLAVTAERTLPNQGRAKKQ